MFLRVTRDGHESVYECDGIHIRPHLTEHDRFLIDIEKDGPRVRPICIEINKSVPEAVGVYLMNDVGRTVDTIFRKDESQA